LEEFLVIGASAVSTLRRPSLSFAEEEMATSDVATARRKLRAVEGCGRDVVLLKLVIMGSSVWGMALIDRDTSICSCR